MSLSCYYLALIIPAAALAIVLGNAFRERDLMDDSIRGIVAITFALTFPAWVMAAHTSSHFILAAMGRGPWEIMNGNLMTAEHFVLTAAQCTALSAVVFGVLSRSWLLFGLGMVNALPTTALMLLEVPGVLLAMVYWLVSTSICIRAWGRSGPRVARVSGPDEADLH